MARTLSSTYLAAQQAANKTPYFKLLFKHKTKATINLSSDGSGGNRILLIDHIEEPYNDYANIIFRNVDRSIPELKGYWVDVGYGYETDAGKEYLGDSDSEPAPARLWVKHQQTISAAGKLWELLELEGMWSRLGETILRMGDPPMFTTTFETDTIYDIIAYILAEIGDPPGMTLEALVEDDGIMNSFQPQFDVNTMPFEYAAAVLYRLLNMTASYLKPLDSLKWEIKYPHPDDPPDLTFYSNRAPYYYEYIERRNVLRPNHIYVFGNEGEEGLWESYVYGEAKEQAEIDNYEDIIRLILAGSVTSQTDCQNRAGALLARARFEQLSGRLVAPNDSRVELYDKVEIDGTGYVPPTMPDPIIYIYDVAGLQAMQNDLTASYALANNIDAFETATWNDGAGFVPIGSAGAHENRFTGKFYGNGHKITDLYIHRPDTSGVGLFGYVSGWDNPARGTIIRDLTIQNAYVAGKHSTGIMVGNCGTYVTIQNCHVSGYVYGYNGAGVGGCMGLSWATVTCCSADVTVLSRGGVTDTASVGGFVGHNHGTIYDSYATGSVTREDGGRRVGGFIGWGGSCHRCYATGNVVGSLSWGYVGGFCGGGVTAGACTDCYARGSVLGRAASYSYTGGFDGAGGMSHERCYSTGSVSIPGAGTHVGGFRGGDWAGLGPLVDCFWDMNTSGWITSAGGTGLTTEQAKLEATYVDAGWDFSTVWKTAELVNDGYPDHIQRCLTFIVFPTDNMTRISSIRRIYKPGTYRMECGLGDLGFGIDVADLGVRKIVGEVEEPEHPPTDEPPKREPNENWKERIDEMIKEQQESGLLEVMYAEKMPEWATKTTAPMLLPRSPEDTISPMSSLWDQIKETYKESWDVLTGIFKGIFGGK